MIYANNGAATSLRKKRVLSVAFLSLKTSTFPT